MYNDRYQQSDMVKLDILLNGQPVDAMATIVHNLKAQRVGRALVEKLKKHIDRSVYLYKMVISDYYYFGSFFSAQNLDSEQANV